jgi:predicted RNA binding protein YcfA (HicA-like mRNA interferase family)
MATLQHRGWVIDRIRGSHYILMHLEQHRSLPIPLHGTELKRGTLVSILRIAGMHADDLR